MTKSNKDGLPHLEYKIENMLDELIKTDEDIENNAMRSSLKFSEDNSSSEEEKVDEELFEKDFFSNSYSQNEEQNQQNKMNNFQNQIFAPILSQNNVNKQITQPINNYSYNNSPFIFNHLFTPPIYNKNHYNPPLFGISNNMNKNINNINMNNNMNNNMNQNMNNNINMNINMNSNMNNINLNNNMNNINMNNINKINIINQKNCEILNSTNSFSTNYEKNGKQIDSNIFDINFSSSSIFNDNINNNQKDNKKNNSLMNYGYNNSNNSFYNESNKYIFKRNKKYHHSYYAGDKICFNISNNSSNYNFKNNISFNRNVELEILLIEVNKILNKIEKIDQICYNKLKGKFEQIIRTHKGSRIFQNYLKNTHTDILHQIFLELKNKLSELLKDNYANYFCKRFFDSLNQKDRIDYLTTIQNDLNSLAIDITATYPIQGIIEQLGSKAEKKIIYLGIKESISNFSYNVYGAHVLEKILSYFEDEFIKEIIDFVYNNFIDLSYHINGICVVKKLILMTHKKDLHKKLKKIIYDNALNLIVHQYGNYVIQVIVENWDDNDLEDIINIYKDKYIYLSKQKYSSNVIERIIEKNQKNLDYFINEICIDNNLSEVMRNNYGNYVVQKAVKLSSGKNQERLIKDIMKNINKIEDKKIIGKWKMIISSSKSF